MSRNNPSRQPLPRGNGDDVVVGGQSGRRQGGQRQGQKQRMAGEVWRSYDAASKGGAAFDGKDLKHLVKEGWSYNDIYKAAAAAGRVNGVADRQLKLLGTADSKYSPFKKDGELPSGMMLEAAFGAPGWGGAFGPGKDGGSGRSYDTDELKQNLRFLGGDPSKKKNWVVGLADDEKGRRAEGYYGTLGRDDDLSWHRLGTRWSDEKGQQQDVLRWGGVDADGRALGLSGVRIKGDDSKFNRQNTSTSWSLPKSFIAERDQAAFNKQMDAYKAANPEPEAKPEAKPKAPAFDPSQFQSTIDGLMAAVQGLNSGSSSDSGSSAPAPREPITVEPVKPVAPVGQNDNGDFLGGFESIINKRYGRPMDWMGDVWER